MKAILTGCLIILTANALAERSSGWVLPFGKVGVPVSESSNQSNPPGTTGSVVNNPLGLKVVYSFTTEAGMVPIAWSDFVSGEYPLAINAPEEGVVTKMNMYMSPTKSSPPSPKSCHFDYPSTTQTIIGNDINISIDPKSDPQSCTITSSVPNPTRTTCSDMPQYDPKTMGCIVATNPSQSTVYLGGDMGVTITTIKKQDYGYFLPNVLVSMRIESAGNQSFDNCEIKSAQGGTLIFNIAWDTAQKKVTCVAKYQK